MDVAISTLTPLRFLQRSEDVWADRPAVRDGDRLWTYSAHGERVRRAAGALRDALGIADGDRVATLLPNVAAMLELHYAVPGAGGVLVPLNTRLAADDYAYILGHAEPRVVVAHPIAQGGARAGARAHGRRGAAGRLGRRASTTRSSPPRSRPSCATPPTSGRSSRSTTRRARPAGRRAS